MSSTVKIRYIGALSPVDVPLARIGGVKYGDEIDVPADVAGRECSSEKPFGEPGLPATVAVQEADPAHFTRMDEHGQWHSHDPGEGLLAQASNWERVKTSSSKTSSDKAGA